MKKIIDGKLYDTETAERIYSMMQMGATGFGEFQETILYRKSNGEYFFNCIGNTWEFEEYIVIEDGTMIDAIIIPTSEEQAKNWCERTHISADRYIEVFGMPEE